MYKKTNTNKYAVQLFYGVLFTLVLPFSTFSQVSIGTNNPDPSAVLELSSVTKGFLLPRMTEAQMEAIVSPAEGLMVYCSDCIPRGMYIYSGTVFESPVTGVTSGLTMEDGDVYNSVTGEVWMDRNLGASQVATASNDAAAYGNYYQWGRNSDGHELFNSTAPGPVAAGTEGSDFITLDSGSEWLQDRDDTRWNKSTAPDPDTDPVKGDHDPCPDGYRVPTFLEWQAEKNSWDTRDAAGAFNSQLKLALAGRRAIYANGGLVGVDTNGHYWSSSTSSGDIGARSFQFNAGSAVASVHLGRARGQSIRCIKDRE